MRTQIVLFCLLFIVVSVSSQTDSAKQTFPLKATNNRSVFNKYPPYIDTVNNTFIYRNQQAPFSRKMLRGTVFVLAADALAFGVLYLTPESFSKWNHNDLFNLKKHYSEAFTKHPVIDKDYWYINYLGHPYQGAYMYNALRSQGADIKQSSLFALVHSCFWEYIVEGSVEQPSAQDLIVTPIGGILLGELLHIATVKMSKNGFKWYEVAFVCVFNPAYALSNGFKFAKPKRNVAAVAP